MFSRFALVEHGFNRARLVTEQFSFDINTRTGEGRERDVAQL